MKSQKYSPLSSAAIRATSVKTCAGGGFSVMISPHNKVRRTVIIIMARIKYQEAVGLETGKAASRGARSAPGIIFQRTLRERFSGAESQDKQRIIDIIHLIFKWQP